jgi:hypothetical protein
VTHVVGRDSQLAFLAHSRHWGPDSTIRTLIKWLKASADAALSTAHRERFKERHCHVDRDEGATLSSSWLFDERTECWSIQTTMTIGAYLDLVSVAHENQGSIYGQRSTLATTTAKRIRARMVTDIIQGAVLPPVVIGLVVGSDAFGALVPSEDFETTTVVSDTNLGELSIIDGMQRTAALLEAVATDPSVRDQALRVEFWLTTSVRAMVYRMLVLNTGQVPWTINRQLTVVYAPLLGELESRVPDIDKLITTDAPGRRVAAAQYRTDSLVELYIAFSLRKTSVDTREQVSDEFSRLDFVDNVADQDFQDQFYDALGMLTRLDLAFSSFQSQDDDARLSRGRHIFDSQPARIGFIVAVGVAVLGRPGANRSPEERKTRTSTLLKQEDALCQQVQGMSNDELGDFLRLDVLREVLDRRVGQVGRYERSVYGEAFKVLIEEEFAVKNMEPCWRAE